MDGDSTRDSCDADATDGPLADPDGDKFLNGDGTGVNDDTCPYVANIGQDDDDGDGQGDLCEPSHKRFITLSLKHVRTDGVTQLRLSGYLLVEDAAINCVRGRSVILERYNATKREWVRLGVDATSDPQGRLGRYAEMVRDSAAKYRARVQAHDVTYDSFQSSCSAASEIELHVH